MSKARPLVLGFDPGETTGISTYDAGHWDALQLPAVAVAPWVRAYLLRMHEHDLNRVIHIGSERYINAPGRGARSTQNAATEVNAQLHMVFADLDPSAQWLRPNLQSAGDAKNLASDGLLRSLGFHKPNMPHANDATRHMLLRVLATDPREFQAIRNGTYRELNTLLHEVADGVR